MKKRIIKDILVTVFGVAAFILLIAEADTYMHVILTKAIAAVLIIAVVCLGDDGIRRVR